MSKNVFQMINEVTSILSIGGISKDRNNRDQGYSFRSIDDIYNALAPALCKTGLCILPKVLERTCAERVSNKGNAIFYVTVKVDFDFVSTQDGSHTSIITYGEAMDSGDKATNKAMSAAYKYACIEAFCIPTIGDNDADLTSPDPVVPKMTIPALEQAALAGSESFKKAWFNLTEEEKSKFEPELKRLKQIAIQGV